MSYSDFRGTYGGEVPPWIGKMSDVGRKYPVVRFPKTMNNKEPRHLFVVEDTFSVTIGNRTLVSRTQAMERPHGTDKSDTDADPVGTGLGDVNTQKSRPID